MALQASGTISFNDLQTQLGGSNPIAITEYTAFSQVANGSAVSLSSFYSKGVSLVPPFGANNFSVTTFGASPQSASFFLENDGDVVSNTTSFGPSDIGDWVNPKTTAAAANFEVRATLDSGSVDGSSTNTWIGLSTTRSWTVSTFGPDLTNSATLTIEIRPIGGSVVASNTVYLEAETSSDGGGLGP